MLKTKGDKMKIIDLQQEDGENKEWLKWREGKLTASTSAPISGIYKYKTPYMLWESLMGMAFPEPENDNMRYGKEMEKYARDAFNIRHGFNFEPVCVEHKEHSEIMIASLDGWDCEKKDCILEIKTPNPTRPNHFSKHLKSVESFKAKYPTYHHQVMWQMMCAGEQIKKCYFATFHNDTIEFLEIYRDDDYIKDCEEKALKWFNKHIVGQIPPEKISVSGEPYNKGDIIFIDDQEAIEIAQQLEEIETRRKERAKKDREDKKLSDELRNKLVSFSDDGDFVCGNISMKRISRNKLDTEKLYQDYNITEEILKKYTSQDIGYWKLTVS